VDVFAVAFVVDFFCIDTPPARPSHRYESQIANEAGEFGEKAGSAVFFGELRYGRVEPEAAKIIECETYAVEFGM